MASREIGLAKGARPTLETVAALAKVSKSTASRVINGSPNVSPDARLAVEAAIQRLGFVPNRMAQGLANRRARSFALVAPTPTPDGLNDPFLVSLAFTASRALAESDAQLVLVPIHDETDRDRLLRYARGGHVDGVILVCLHGADPFPALLRDTGIPVVLGGRPLRPIPGIPYVDVDNVGGAVDATRHLIEHGRERIATIAGLQDMCSGIDRLTGFRKAMTKAGRSPNLVAYGDFSEERAEEAMLELLDRQPDLDAVYAASDPMAAGALRAIRRTGRRVPDDIAIIGDGDYPIASHTEPPLTTMRQPVNQMATHLTSALLAVIAGETNNSPRILPAELIIRGSS